MKITERNNLVEANMRLVYYTYAKLYKNSFVVNNTHIKGGQSFQRMPQLVSEIQC